jgi:hypothetical protein
MSDAETFEQTFCRKPDIRNMGGWCLASIALPNYTRCPTAAVRTKVFSDLLAIEIADHLGQPMIIDDYYLGSPYRRDKQTGRAFSVGPDRKPNTEDDIVLGKK